MNCSSVPRDLPRRRIYGGNVKPPLTNFVATGYVIVKQVHCFFDEVNLLPKSAEQLEVVTTE